MFLLKLWSVKINFAEKYQKGFILSTDYNTPKNFLRGVGANMDFQGELNGKGTLRVDGRLKAEGVILRWMADYPVRFTLFCRKAS
jgi:hypothetical protein